MRLRRAATRFDDSMLFDAYTNALVGRGQLDPTDIFKLDGASVRRRVISVAPEVSPPTRRAVRLGTDAYLIGEPSTDEWKGSPIRTKYVLHHTPGQVTIKSIEEALSNQAGRMMYASREWNKDVPDSQTSSAYFNDYHIFISYTESVKMYDLLWIDGQWHICHAVHPSLSGFTDAVSHEILGTVFETVALGSRSYDPVTDSYTSNPTNATVLRLRWAEQYSYMTAAQTSYVRGDETVMVLKSAWPEASASDVLTLSDGRWRVIDVQDQGAVLALHTRRD